MLAYLVPIPHITPYGLSGQINWTILCIYTLALLQDVFFLTREVIANMKYKHTQLCPFCNAQAFQSVSTLVKGGLVCWLHLDRTERVPDFSKIYSSVRFALCMQESQL